MKATKGGSSFDDVATVITGASGPVITVDFPNRKFFHTMTLSGGTTSNVYVYKTSELDLRDPI
jgi:hypothetical protein